MHTATSIDSKNGIQRKFNEDGSYEETYWIYPGGVAQIRKIVDVDVEGNRSEIYRAYYDDQGNLLKDWKLGGFERKRVDNNYEVWIDGVKRYVY